MAEVPSAGHHEGPTSRLYLHPDTMHACRLNASDLLLVSSGGCVALTGHTSRIWPCLGLADCTCVTTAIQFQPVLFRLQPALLQALAVQVSPSNWSTFLIMAIQQERPTS